MSQRFEFIDGLRGIAALTVVFFHLNVAIQQHDPHAVHNLTHQVFSIGYIGIPIFFVLSGFVIAYNLRHEQITFSFFARFYVRRSLRLDPPYWAVMVLTLALAGIANLTFKSGADFPFTPLQIFYNLVYLPDLMQVPLIVPVGWTLCIEFQFYLVYALLIMLVQRTGMKNIYALFIWGSLSLFSVLQSTPWAIMPSKPITFIPSWYGFFLGCTTCWAMMGKIDKKFLWFNYLMITVCSFWTPSPHVIASVGVALLIHLVALSDGLHHVLQEFFFQYLGKISYSLYLIHWPIGVKLVDIAYKIGGNEISIPLLWIISMFLMILAADLFYRLIERPSHNFSRNFNRVYGAIRT